MVNQRTEWVDYAKGIGIILVVYAHLLSSGFHAGLSISDRFFMLSDSGVYSFHMPLFFFLAGLFAQQSLEKRDFKNFCLDKLLLLAYPYVIWSLIQGAVELLASGQSHRGMSFSDLFFIPVIPLAHFWFLYALFLMYISFGIFHKLGRYASAFMIITASVLFFFPIPIDFAAIHGFSTGFLFFIAGYIINKNQKILYKLSIPGWLTCVLFCLLVLSIFVVFDYFMEPARLPDGSNPICFLYLSVVGIAFCVGLAQFLARNNWFGWVKIFGVHSIRIYLVHMLAGVAVRIILLSFFSIENPVIHIFFGVCGGLLIPLMLYKLTKRLNFPYLFELKTTVSKN